MIQKKIDSISGILSRLESRFGLFFTSCIVATILLACAMIYVQPLFTVAFHGIPFSLLSENPFDLSTPNPLRYRILAPFIGYLVFLRGDNFFILPLITTWIFPAIVYFRYRKKNVAAIDSLLITSFIVFSCVVLLPLIAPAYTDIITWLLIFLAFTWIEKIPLSALFFSLAILNHESSIVLLPALILYSYQKNRHRLLLAICLFLLACIPHLCYRWYIDLNTETVYNVSFYLSESNIFFTLKKLILYLPAAVFYAFKLWWVFPVCFIGWAAYYRKYIQCSIILLILAGAFSLILISYDYTRMLVIAFPAVLLSYEWMMKIYNPEKFRKFSFVLVALNLLILQYHFNYDGAQPMFPWILNKISEMLGMPIY
ncbi:hypothetical protein BH11BAC1_BH11BAC1_27470 [soil metagenome]